MRDDDLLRNLSLQPSTEPDPPVTEDVFGQHPEGPPDIPLIVVNDDDHESTAGFPLHAFDAEGSPRTDSDVSMIVNLGASSPDTESDHGEDDLEYRISCEEETLSFPSLSPTSSLLSLRESSSSEDELELIGRGRSRRGVLANGIRPDSRASARAHGRRQTSDSVAFGNTQPIRNGIPFRTRNGYVNRRTPRSAPDFFPYPQRQGRFREPRQQSSEEDEREELPSMST